MHSLTDTTSQWLWTQWGNDLRQQNDLRFKTWFKISNIGSVVLWFIGISTKSLMGAIIVSFTEMIIRITKFEFKKGVGIDLCYKNYA